jgi:hypothetical protein
MEKELYALKSQLDLDNQLKLQAQAFQYKVELAKLQASLAKSKAKKSSGGSSKKSSGGKSTNTGITVSTTKTDKELQKEYDAADKRVHQWIASEDGISTEGLQGFMGVLRKEGVSDEVIVALKQKYDL